MASDKIKKKMIKAQGELEHYSDKARNSCLWRMQRMRADLTRKFSATGEVDFEGVWREYEPLIQSVIRDMMVVGHLRGYQIAEEILREGKTKLSIYEKAIRVLKDYNKLTAAQLGIIRDEYGAYAASITGEIGSVVDNNIKAATTEIVEKNMHVVEAKNRIREAFNKSGIVPAHKGVIETLARTNIRVAYGTARWQMNQDEAINKILWGYEYFTAGDGDVRPNHAALDGVRLPKEDGRWSEIWPPNGFNCRCDVIEIFDPVSKIEPTGDGGADKGWEFNVGQRSEVLRSTRPAG